MAPEDVGAGNLFPATGEVKGWILDKAKQGFLLDQHQFGSYTHTVFNKELCHQRKDNSDYSFDVHRGLGGHRTHQANEGHLIPLL